MNIKIAKINPNAKLPTQATEGSDGLDLYATEVVYDKENNKLICKSGIAIELPKGYCGLLFPRSSVSFTRLRLANSVGLIDNDYRGEITAVFDIKDFEKYKSDYKVGDRFAQLKITASPNVNIEEVPYEELSSTTRGKGGYGSTGK